MDIEKELVLNSYSQIAKEFDHTRHTPWPSVKKFIVSLPESSSILDAGCGNGKNMLIRKDLKWTGCDFCPEFLDICRSKELSVIEADVRKLPFPDDHFDNTICIAVIHHLSSFDDRVKACQELIRVTKQNGEVLIQVWQNQGITTDKFQKMENGDEGDHLISWTLDDKSTIRRFYHLFHEKEINELLSKLSGVNVLEKYIEAGNWIILLEKN